jgi:hypothetical protein
MSVVMKSEVRLSLHHRLFVKDWFVNWCSYKMCRKLKRKYTASPAPKTTSLEQIFHFRQEVNTQRALAEESKKNWCSTRNIYKKIFGSMYSETGL